MSVLTRIYGPFSAHTVCKLPTNTSHAKQWRPDLARPGFLNSTAFPVGKSSFLIRQSHHLIFYAHDLPGLGPTLFFSFESKSWADFVREFITSNRCLLKGPLVSLEATGSCLWKYVRHRLIPTPVCLHL